MRKVSKANTNKKPTCKIQSSVDHRNFREFQPTKTDQVGIITLRKFLLPSGYLLFLSLLV
jgi:hypothetical protein